MSMIVLHHSGAMSIATNRRVIPAHEVGTLQSMCEHADALSARLSSEESRIKEIEEQSRVKGYQSGYEAGKHEALEMSAQERAHEREQLIQEQSKLESQATAMAFDIVRRLADTLDPAELLSALAITAARSSAPEEQLTLRVHESYRDSVASRLESATCDVAKRFTHILGDATVDTTACIIESKACRVLADLQTQTDLLEMRLGNG